MSISEDTEDIGQRDLYWGLLLLVGWTQRER